MILRFSSVIFAENETRNENAKYSFVRNRKWPKPSNLVIFGAENENENEFRSVSIIDQKSASVTHSDEVSMPN